MIFIINIFYKSVLHVAAVKNNTEILKLLLARPNIDINLPYISNEIFFHEIFFFNCFHSVFNRLFNTVLTFNISYYFKSI